MQSTTKAAGPAVELSYFVVRNPDLGVIGISFTATAAVNRNPENYDSDRIADKSSCHLENLAPLFPSHFFCTS